MNVEAIADLGTNVTDRSFEFTSESVGEGHPDKVCDYIADSILDAHLAADPNARVACEVLCKNSTVVLAGEISSEASIDLEGVVRKAIQEIGYSDAADQFCSSSVEIRSWLSRQSPEISDAVGRGDSNSKLGAGDQGMMFGFASVETPELMPLPILLAHRITAQLSRDRKSGRIGWLRPDAKAQVTVRYAADIPQVVRTVLVSTQHSSGMSPEAIRSYVESDLVPNALGNWYDPSILILANPSGSFVEGGPSADCGVTGRKIIADTYGGFARHGGGAFSGKDPTKVDRSAAYFCRFVARQLVLAGVARRAEVRVAYAIGEVEPVSIDVDTFGTGDVRQARQFLAGFDFRPKAILECLGMRRPIYRHTTNFGHFGRPGSPWEVPTVNSSVE